MFITEPLKILDIDGGSLEVLLEFSWANSYSKSNGSPNETALEVEQKYKVCQRFADEVIKPILIGLTANDDEYLTISWLISSENFEYPYDQLFESISNDDLEDKIKEEWYNWTAGGGSGIDTEPKRKDKPKTPFYETEKKFIDPNYIKLKVRGR